VKYVVALVLLLIVCGRAHANDAEHCPILPADSALQWTYLQGPDFSICYAHRAKSDVKMFGFYLGCCPDFYPAQLTALEPGVVSGRDVTWYSAEAQARVGPFSRQTVISLESRYRYVAHVWIIADTQKGTRRCALHA
jgi:hypothetical protein